MSLLTLNRLVVGYSGRGLSSPLNLEVSAGTSLGIIGGNGTGKTTLVKTLMGLIPPLEGEVFWKQGTRFGYVPQENQVDMLFPLRILDLLKMGMVGKLPRFRNSSPSLKEAIHSILAEMEISSLKHSLVRDVSGGERQRSLIARAWVSKPDVLIMDEPFNSLDYLFKEKLWRIFANWKENHPLTLVMIDHDLNRIINQVDQVIVLGSHGTVCGSTREVITPENLTKAYGAPLHVHHENGNLQVHFL